MAWLHPIDPLFSLDKLAGKIGDSSNFQFAWQFYAYAGIDLSVPAGARSLLQLIAESPECHAFLRSTFDPVYDDTFHIEAPHCHAKWVPAIKSLPSTLAAAAADVLGAYSRVMREATVREGARVERQFREPGEFVSFELQPGSVKGCGLCAEHNNHLFSNWFNGVAWDWCFVAAWPRSKRAWIGCLTDTD